MLDFIKRMAIALILMVFIGMMIFGGKMIHAQDASGWRWPVNGVNSRSFASRDREHKGVDIAAPKGTPVVAAHSGWVKKSYRSHSYGNVIFIVHPNGFETVCAHLSKRLEEKGDHVDKGELIGKVGNTGDSTVPYLHFEAHRGLWNINKTNTINPILFLGQEQQKVVNTNNTPKSEKEK